MSNKILLTVGALIIVAGVGAFFVLQSRTNLDETYNPAINPSEFSTTVDNPYFTLTPGTKFVYEAQKTEGLERIEVTILPETRTVMGVNTVVVKDQVFLDGELIEDTLDWYAEDSEGNVWYFGEETAEYENGVVTTTAGSWEAGVDGALPGIIMKANPRVGDSYRQEYYKGEAEDMADILSVHESATVPYGAFTECIKTYDYTPLQPSAQEQKYYCKDVGFVVLEVNLEDDERVELVSVTKNSTANPAPTSSTPAPSTSTPTPAPTTQKDITEAEARSIALARVPGTVTAVEIETKFGKQTYVVEVKPSGGGAETDVIIDIKTGEVLAVEN